MFNPCSKTCIDDRNEDGEITTQLFALNSPVRHAEAFGIRKVSQPMGKALIVIVNS